jgi:TolB-like protein/Tfp pilus assembly protein PilF
MIPSEATGMPDHPNDERLDSWKEIATYFRRDVRTVRLWEEKEGLPVHRHIHHTGGSVYAYKPELDAWREGRRSGTSKRTRNFSLAVLPFKNLSSDPEQVFLGDGLTEEMITQLSRLRADQLHVTACASVMLYKDSDKSIEQIAHELGVNFLLQGTVRRDGDRMRITVQLIDVRRKTNLWAEVYEHSISNVFALQSELAERIASSLDIGLLRSTREMLRVRTTYSPAAFDAHLKGRYHWNKRTRQGLEKAVGCFEEAIRFDPEYPLPYSGLADAYTMLAGYGLLSPADAMPKARAAALKAVELDPSLAEAHASLGEVKMYFDWEWDSAERQYRRAIDLQPGYTSAHYWYANLLCVLQRETEALQQVSQALHCDPLSPLTNAWAGLIFYHCGRYDSAARQCQLVLDMEPSYALAHWVLGMAQEQRGKPDEAIKELRKAVAHDGGSSRSIGSFGHACGAAGHKQEALQALHDLKHQRQQGYISAYDIAVAYAGLEKKDAAIESLKKAFEEHATWLPFVAVDPRLNNLHSNVAFQELLHGMRLRVVERTLLQHS